MPTQKPAPSNSGWPDYIQSIAKNLSPIYKFCNEAGRGENGIAYKLQHRRSGLFFCLKTLTPDVLSKESRAEIAQDIINEINILSPLSHKSLPQIFQSDINPELPYYICTYHPGDTFAKFADKLRVLSEMNSILVINSLIDAFRYLHANGRSHADFHLRNVMVSENVYQEGILIIDFGAGKRQSAEKRLPESSQESRKVPASPNGAQSDFRGFGCALKQLTECLFGAANIDQKLAYQEFCKKLINGQFKSWNDVYEAFLGVQNPSRLATRLERLLIAKDGSRQAITIPVSKRVPVGDATIPVINTDAFQRLRYIKQLSFCDWYYPGGVHTRFEHSLGVMEQVRKAVGVLVHNSEFRNRYDQSEIDALFLSGLLHDVGHYPFAHILEHYVESRFAATGNIDIARGTVSHSDNSVFILQNDKQLMQAIDTPLTKGIREKVILLIKGRKDALAQILSGPIDCDKLDYLMRDSHHCGVPFGSGIDEAGILKSYQILDDGKKLGISFEGIRPVEGFLVAQVQMLGAVYWQESVRSVISMFHALIAHIVGKDIDKLLEITKLLKNCLGDQQALELLLERGIKLVKTGDREKLSQLVELHREPNFKRIYPKFAEYKSTFDLAEQETTSETHRNIVHSILENPKSGMSKVPIVWKSVAELRRCFVEAFKSNNIAVKSTEILIDVPFGKLPNHEIVVSDPSFSKEESFTGFSHLNRSIFEQPTGYLNPIRIFVSPKVMESAANRIEMIQGSAEKNYLEHRFVAPGIEEL